MNRLSTMAFAALLSFSLAGCISFGGGGQKDYGGTGFHDGVEFGMASWYGKPYHGRQTASGEKYNMNEMTAAHRTLPFGTKVKVTRLDNGRQCVVRINDRGPFVRGRVIDLSRESAKKLDLVIDGIADVKVEII